MKHRSLIATLISLLALPCAAPALLANPELSAGDLRKSGTIHFEVTCEPELKEEFQAAVALLHSFFYDEARRRFEDIAQRDPRCAMAWWGVAMTYYHPLWAPPTPDEMDKGVEAVEKAKAIGAATDLERGFLEAIDAFFRTEEGAVAGQPVQQSCHGPRAHGARADAFKQSMEKLHGLYPENLEVRVFYTLALIATAPPTDKTYANQKKATAMLEPLFAQNPDHPGIPHYIIHAYDYPELAERALNAARHYGDIAPWVPHALHMPTHIYTRLGMWEDSIEGNLTSVNAARDYTARVYSGGVWYDELHALDYLMFAYLQTAQDRKADELRDYVRRIQHFVEPNFAAAYAIGAIPARCVLERRHWKEAATLEVLHLKEIAPYPFALAHVEFARAVGAGRSGEVAAARQAVSRLAKLRSELTDPKFEWWTTQIEIQQLAGEGWLALAEGNRDEALARLRKCADLEDSAGTHPVTPGQLLPAREQLGDLLMELGRPTEALDEYQSALKAFPNRFNGHFGAGQAAERTGNKDVASHHYQQLLSLAKDGDGARMELNIARRFLGMGSVP